MIRVGGTLTSSCELFNDAGEIVLAKGEKVVVRFLMIREGHWSNICDGLWIPDELYGILLEDKYGMFKPKVFKEYEKSLNKK
ncbi:MAG: hypothetical protein WC333_00010 [Dehalococcoidia bacterium]|jgi:hypothetical protein